LRAAFAITARPVAPDPVKSRWSNGSDENAGPRPPPSSKDKGAKRGKPLAPRQPQDTAARAAVPGAARGVDAPVDAPADAAAGAPIAAVATRNPRWLWIVVVAALALGAASWWLSRTKAPAELKPVVAAASASAGPAVASCGAMYYHPCVW